MDLHTIPVNAWTLGLDGLTLAMVTALAAVILLRPKRAGTDPALLAANDAMARKIEVLESHIEKLERGMHHQLRANREEVGKQQTDFRTELTERFDRLDGALSRRMTGISDAQRKQLEVFANRLSENLDRQQKSTDALSQMLRDEQAKLEKTIADGLTSVREDNAKKLDQMRQTVDEKLQGTLEKRLGESFKQVGEQLDRVHRGLGEMQTLATGVGDLKKVLTNVKTRGGWGEVQLGALLEDVLAPDQYVENAQVRKGSAERVEFAIKLPGKDEGDGPVLLPLDAKFPKEDYERLVDAGEAGDPAAMEAARKQLDAAVKQAAKTISDKYVVPPATTDFALMYLPTEGLYAEVVRRPGLVDALQRDYRVVVVGHTTFTALLNSLQMGFRTLAIQKRSSEVWEVLGAVKAEFGKFGGVLEKVKTKLNQASREIDQAEVRTRAIERNLRGVEALPAPEAGAALRAPDL